MSRPLRWFLRGAQALSALLCLATAALWLRSYSVPAAYRFSHNGEACEATLAGGQIQISNYPAAASDAAKRDPDTLLFLQPRGTGPLTLPAPRVAQWSYQSRMLLPLLAVVFAVLPGWPVLRRQRCQPEWPNGLCRHCGYDLRATPGRCPECGMVPDHTGRPV